MKIGSHSGLLSGLINILSAKTGPVCEQEGPRAHTCWQEARGQRWGLAARGQRCGTGGTPASGGGLGPSKGLLGTLITARLAGTQASLRERP